LGNSIVAGLSAKSGNGQLSAKEQAALDQKMAAMDKKIQAKLNGQPGTTDPVIQMQSQNGVLVPQGSNAVEIFDWYKENGLLDGMDDKQYHKLALAANAYEDKQLARIQASMDYSQTLQQDLIRKQYSVDASSYRLAELTHEMKYYALGGHNGVFDQYGKDPKVTLIPWRVQSDEGSKAKTPSLLEKFGNVQPGPWAAGYVIKNADPFDWSGTASTVGTYTGAAGSVAIAGAKYNALDILQRAKPLHESRIAAIGNAQSIADAQKVVSASSKSGQALAALSVSGVAARSLPVISNAASVATVIIDTTVAKDGEKFATFTGSSASALGQTASAIAGFKLGAAAGVFFGPLSWIAVPVLGGVTAAGFAIAYDVYGVDDFVKDGVIKQVR
jgi:hypothetical protein